ncbi:Mechanosensitive ion channel protein [Heracleum sosnowskyi]|uniref:Mechanosensitive ion channel protein n=1 Tax=Heracleum sosnowskyi TaxID=360622 RepID=A0AAD8H3X2_9APIA|nr:Mechanosensitive ion channel protein [Heracleum sosnowskyi]
MNLFSSYNKSLRSHGSFKCSTDLSDVTNEPPILSAHHSEVILKIDDDDDISTDDNSFQFCTNTVDDLGEISLDVNSEATNIPNCETEVKESKVSFKTQLQVSSSDDDLDPDDDHISGQRLRSRLSNKSYNNGASNKGLKGKSILRGKSRLADRPVSRRRSRQEYNLGRRKSGEGSGIVEKASDEDDDETSNDDDLPLHLKKLNFNTFTLLECISLVLIVSFLICTLVFSKWKTKKLHGLQIWKWEVFSLVLVCGRLVSDWVIRFLVLCIERNFMLRKRVVYFVYALRKSVQNCVWLSLVLVAWNELFDKKVLVARNRFLWFVDKILWCMLAVTLTWLVKTLIIKVLASSFHVKTFFDRIQDTLFNQYVIEMLSGPPIAEVHEKIEEEGKLMVEISKFEDAETVLPPELREAAFRTLACGEKGPVKQSSGITPNKNDDVGVISKKQDEDTMPFSQLHKLNRRNVSAWNMKRLIKLVRHGALTTLDEHLQGLSTNDQNPSTKQISSEHEAKVAAKRIFQNVARRRSKYIYMQDLLRFLGDDEAEKAMEIIEGTPASYKISKKDLGNWVVNAFIERKALAFSLNDTKTAVNKLHNMVNVLVSIIIVIISLVILGLTSRQLLVAISSQLVVVTFIFGNTCKTIFEALIFLFVMHPFDVGDRCEIGGVQMVVEEMNILTTVFLRYDSQKIIYPNSTLSTMPIHNLYRSPDMDDAIDFWFHIATPAEKINVVKQRIVSYIDNKKDHWYSNPIIVMRDVVDLNRIKMSLWPTHKMNHQNAVERYKRRGLLIEQIVKIVKEMDIEYLLYPIDINLRDLPPANSTQTNLASS